MSDQSKFSDKDIEQQRRRATGKHANVDYDQLQVKSDWIGAARADSLEVFQAKIIAYGIELNSEQGKKIIEAYWAIRREPRR